MQKLATLLAISLSTLVLQSCSTAQKETAGTPQTPSTTAQGASTPQQDFIEMEGYRFSLEPDVQSDGVAHLDFYVRDTAGAHVKGVTGNFRITKPDSSKVEIPIQEESPHDHYHGMLKLDQPGEYLIVAQVSVAGKKLNPRFSFSRKQ